MTPTPPSDRDTALSACRAVFDAAPGSPEAKHDAAYDEVCFGRTEDFFDYIYDVIGVGA